MKLQKGRARVCARTITMVLLAGLAAWCAGAQAPPSAERWEKTIGAFEARDKEAPPPTGAILFIGSSSIRLWDLGKHFPKLTTVKRGFGGSFVSDSVAFAPRIVLPYKPKVIVLYAGDNDIAAGKTPETVRDDFTAFVRLVHKDLPETRIVFLAIKPSLARWRLVGAMRRANELVRAVTEKDPRLRYVDTDTPMLGADGTPRKELFVADGLHLSHEGYVLWTSLLRPHLETSEEKGSSTSPSCSRASQSARHDRRRTVFRAPPRRRCAGAARGSRLAA